MGNWRTVYIIGKCDYLEVQKLKELIDCKGPDYNNFHCLCNTGSICGLGDWSDEVINSVGNLSERDYSIKEVAERLKKIASQVPSLEVDIHCGEDYEDKKCIKTIRLRKEKVSIINPEIEKIPDISESQIQTNILKQLMR